jgi:hypothetical protein
LKGSGRFVGDLIIIIEERSRRNSSEDTFEISYRASDYGQSPIPFLCVNCRFASLFSFTEWELLMMSLVHWRCPLMVTRKPNDGFQHTFTQYPENKGPWRQSSNLLFGLSERNTPILQVAERVKGLSGIVYYNENP